MVWANYFAASLTYCKLFVNYVTSYLTSTWFWMRKGATKASPNPLATLCVNLLSEQVRRVLSFISYCCSVGELKITFASTCKESVFNVLFNVLFLVLDFPLGAPNTLLKHVIERSIWRIVVGEGSWWGWGFSQDWWLGFWSCWSLSLTAVFWIDFSVACFKRV